MGKTLLTRLAVVGAGGALALAAAAPALAHDAPADGFDAVLQDSHHNTTVISDQFPELCDDVKEQFGDLIMPGHEVWVFNIPGGQFNESDDPLASIQFDSVTVDIPGYDPNLFSTAPAANPHNLGVAVPAGSTLVDGDFNVTPDPEGDVPRVVVTHTCSEQPGPSPSPTPSPTPTNGEDGEDGENGENGENGEGGENGDEDDAGLPVTGLQTGGLVALGAGLLAAGAAAMLVARRRRSAADLIDG